MKWIKKNNTFILSRDELAKLHLFGCSIAFTPKKFWPSGYDEFRRKSLNKSGKALLEYMKYLKAE